MRRDLVTIVILAGAGLLLLGPAQTLSTTAQTQGVLWINDTNGIYELALDGSKPKLLIPTETLGAIGDMAVDAQGQIFLLDVSISRRILKATPSGQVSVVLDGLSIRPQAMGVDAQGNIILAELQVPGNSQSFTVYRVDSKGRASEVVRLCSGTHLGTQFSISLTVDKTGDYIVALTCDKTLQLVRVTPAGEATVIVNNDPKFQGQSGSGDCLHNVILDPAGQGYFLLGCAGIFHISPTGEVAFITEDWPAYGLTSLAIAPSGDLFAVRGGLLEVIRFFPNGSRKVLHRGAPLVFPTGILWVGK